MKPEENAKKSNCEENADPIIRRSNHRKNLPRTAGVAGGRDEKGAMAKQIIVESLPRIVSVVGGRDEERRTEGKHRS